MKHGKQHTFTIVYNRILREQGENATRFYDCVQLALCIHYPQPPLNLADGQALRVLEQNPCAFNFAHRPSEMPDGRPGCMRLWPGR